MNNKTIILILLIAMFSCNHSKLTMITKKQIGGYFLGQKLDEEHDKNIFDIQTDKNNLITSVIVSDKNYRTKEGFGVGTNMDSIKQHFKKYAENDIPFSKGSTYIGSFGTVLVCKKIAFIDGNDDKIIDYVWIEI